MSETASGDVDDFEESPKGWYGRWTLEIEASEKALKKFHEDGDAVDKEFRGEADRLNDSGTRLEVFASSVQTKRAMLYGKAPAVSVDRTFADANDDVARVSGELTERLLNGDIDRDCDGYEDALRNALDDWLLPGLAATWCRYESTMEAVEGKPAILDETTGKERAPAIEPSERKSHEDVQTEYVHWKDFFWSAGARVWSEVTWVARRVRMTRKQLRKRFGDGVANLVKLNAPAKKEGDEAPDPWARAEVFEIWDKESQRTFWFTKGHGETLDIQKDPLGLEGFFPCPRPMMANLTTAKLVPRPDWAMAQDLYVQINELASRIKELTTAVRASGLYDASAEGVKELMTEAGRNELIPVKNWPMIADKGGLQGVISWFPVEQVVKSIAVLQERMTILQDQLFQITGWADIMRGEATQAGATATEQRIKGRFGSVRIQAAQDEFARFASDTQAIRAEIISKHFDDDTIIARSNARFMTEADQALVPQAIAMMRSSEGCYRVKVKPEAISMSDFMAEKAAKTEVINTIAGFVANSMPLLQLMPTSLPFLLRMLQWLVAGERGASGIEGVLDQAIAAAEQSSKQAAANPQQQPEDPKVAAEKAKMQTAQMQNVMKMQQEEQKMKNALVIGQAEVQNDAQREENQRRSNVQEAAQRQIISNALKPPAPPPARGGRGL